MNSALSNYARSVAPRSHLGFLEHPRVRYGDLKAAKLEIHAETMRSGLPAAEMERIQIARGLLLLQQQKRLLVWIGLEGLFVAEYVECLPIGGTRRRKIDWEKAAKIVDNPDRWINKIVFGGKA